MLLNKSKQKQAKASKSKHRRAEKNENKQKQTKAGKSKRKQISAYDWPVVVVVNRGRPARHNESKRNYLCPLGKTTCHREACIPIKANVGD